MSAPVEHIIEGFAAPQQALTYVHLPFEVPPGTERIDVHYDYSAAIHSDPHLTGGNTVDLGVFDPRGVDPPGPGFRGWSGSSRSEFFIARDEATPGYVPGPLQAGTWHIYLGFYKVAEQGCEYRVTVRLTPAQGEPSSADTPALLPLRERAPAGSRRDRNGWYKGDLHCHSHHSDGDSPPRDIVAAARELGLDFLAVTDHNVYSQQAVLNQIDTPLMLIPGTEVTTYKGHWNIWGRGEWIDFRILTAEAMTAAIEKAVKAGYLVSCNHPRDYGPPWEFADVTGYHCVEVWNGPWQLFNTQSLAFWEQRLRAGQRLVAVGGSDCHRLKEEHIARLGQPTTWIYCPGEPSPAGILAGLRAGHAFVSAAPDGPQLYLRAGDAMMGDTLPPASGESPEIEVRAVDAAGLNLEIHSAAGCLERLPVQQADQTFTLAVTAELYIRAQLVEDDADATVHALTNPLYLSAI
jgi:hypothetical protein